MVIFQIYYLLPCTTAPACQPEIVGQGMAIRVGSSRREIIKLKYNLDGKKHFFSSFEGNGIIKNCVTRLIRGRKLISVTQFFCDSTDVKQNSEYSTTLFTCFEIQFMSPASSVFLNCRNSENILEDEIVQSNVTAFKTSCRKYSTTNNRANN